MALCPQSYWCYIDTKKNFFLHPSLYLLVSWAWCDWPLTWLANHRPSVLWHCWLAHMTRKTVSEMTYNVSRGTLNSTILQYYSASHLVPVLLSCSRWLAWQHTILLKMSRITVMPPRGFMLDALPVATWTWDQWHSIQVNGDILRWLGWTWKWFFKTLV